MIKITRIALLTSSLLLVAIAITMMQNDAEGRWAVCISSAVNLISTTVIINHGIARDIIESERHALSEGKQ